MNLRKLVAAAAMLASCMGLCGGIDWQTPQDIAGDQDVRTNGVLRYAFSWGGLGPDTVVVNGQVFVPCGISHRAGAEVESPYLVNWEGAADARSWVSNQTATATCSATYLNILRRAFFSAPEQAASGQLVLKQLVPGRRYEVQIWSCCVFPDLVGATMTLDGTCTLAGCPGPVESPRMGQHVVGAFVCPSSGEQAIGLSAPEGVPAFVNALQVRDVTDDDVIAWEVHDIVDDADVRTEGTLLYAYAMSDASAVVNGVPFKGARNAVLLPSVGNEDYADLFGSGYAGWTPDAYGAAGLSADYAALVKGGPYSDRKSIRMTLCGLVPGRSYLVQLWVNDTRSLGVSRSLSVDGRCRVAYKSPTGAGNGQYVLGRFVAVTPKQPVDLVVDETPSAGQSAQWNAIQVRQLTPTPIEWESARAMTGDADVVDAGEPVYAYYWGAASPLTVNGTTFAFAGGNAGVISTHIRTVGFTGVNTFTDFFPTWSARGCSENHYLLLNHGIYGARTREGSVTLCGLEPGARYLVQIFSGDMREIVAARGTLVDGLVRLYQTDGIGNETGNFVVGRFTATGTEQTFPVRALARSGTSSSECSLQINAIQVRRLAAAPTEPFRMRWTPRAFADGTDVATEGNLAYAYTYAAADLTVNGVTFRATGDRTKLGDDVAFARAFTGGPHRAFDSGYNGYAGEIPAGPYRTLLACGVYDDNHFSAQTYTLRNLKVGHAYLVQMWANDLRNQNNARRWTFDGQAAAAYNRQFMEGRFVAAAGTQSISIAYYNQNCQLNALQLRDLGLAEGPLHVADGALALDEDLTTNAVCSAAALAVPGPGGLDAPAGVFAPSATVDAPWTGTSLLQAGQGETTLNGPADALETVEVQAGRLALNGAVATAPLVTVAAGARLSVGPDADLRVRALDGSGVYAWPGSVTLDNLHAGRTAADLADGLTVEKTGFLDWIFTGALDGATVNAVTGRVVVADGAKTGAFGLSGDVRFLDATVAGALTATDDLTTEGLVFGPGASLALAGTAELHAKGGLDLGGVEIRVGTARRPGGNVLVRADGVLSGAPSCVFDAKGFQAFFDADLNAWCARYAASAVIYVR